MALVDSSGSEVPQDICHGTEINFQNLRGGGGDAVTTWGLLNCNLNLILRYSTTVNTKSPVIVVCELWSYLLDWSIQRLLVMPFPPVQLFLDISTPSLSLTSIDVHLFCSVHSFISRVMCCSCFLSLLCWILHPLLLIPLYFLFYFSPFTLVYPP